MRRGHGALANTRYVPQKITPVSKKRTPPPPPPGGISDRGCGLQPGPRYLNGPGKGRRLRAAHLGRQIPARRTGPYVLENPVGFCPEDVPNGIFTIEFVRGPPGRHAGNVFRMRLGLRVSAVRRPSGPVGSLTTSRCAHLKKAFP